MRSKKIRWFITVFFFVAACDDGDDSPSKGKLVFVKLENKPGIYTMALEGNDLKRVAGETDLIYWPGNPFGGQYYTITSQDGMAVPRWSPDGKKIAFNLTFGFEGDAVILMDENGGNKKILASGYGAQWSPSGTKLLVYNLIVDTSGQLLNQINLFENNMPYYFQDDTLWFFEGYQWGSNDDEIVVSASVNIKPVGYPNDNSRFLNIELFLIDVSGGTITQKITQNSEYEKWFVLSPKGDYIIYYNYNLTGVALLRIPDSQIIVIPSLSTISQDQFVSGFQWATDGSGIVFVKDDDPSTDIKQYMYWLDINDVSTYKRLAKFRARDPNLFRYDI